MKLNNIRLLTTNFDDSFRFYSGVLGFEVVWGAPGEAYAHFRLPGGELALFDRRVMAEVVGTQQLPAKACAQDTFALVISVKSVDETYHELLAKGVKFIGAPVDHREWGIRTAHLRDPEGNLLELSSDLPDGARKE